MKFDEFGLERWLLKDSEIDLGGGGVIKLALGDLVAGLDLNQKLKYGRTDGSDYLKRLIADWYKVEVEQVLVTSGTSEANLLVNLALLEQGDHYVTEVPMYEQTVSVAKAIGCRIRKFHLIDDRNWKPDLEELKKEVSSKTRIVFLDNPNNPTGALLSKAEMNGICEIANDAGAWVHCDNALRGSELDKISGFVPFPKYNQSIVTGSISKLGVTSPRIGWIIGSKELVKRCWVIKDYTTLGHSRIGEILAGRVLSLRSELINRNLTLSRTNLTNMGKWIEKNHHLTWVKPLAGFTGFPKFDYKIDSIDFCERLLEEEKVLVSPGAYFGLEKYLRICTGIRNDLFIEGINRIDSFMDQLV